MLYYNKDGGVQAVSAETLTEGIYEMAKESGWIMVEWFIGFLSYAGNQLSKCLGSNYIYDLIPWKLVKLRKNFHYSLPGNKLSKS